MGSGSLWLCVGIQVQGGARTRRHLREDPRSARQVPSLRRCGLAARVQGVLLQDVSAAP